MELQRSFQILIACIVSTTAVPLSDGLETPRQQNSPFPTENSKKLGKEGPKKRQEQEKKDLTKRGTESCSHERPLPECR